MMKIKISRLLILCLAAALVTGCYKDKGDYDYRELIAFYIDTAGAKTSYTAQLFEQLEINPKVVYGGEATNLDYLWKVYPKLAELAEISGVATDGTQEEKAKKFIEKIYELNRNMEIPVGFDFIKDEDIPKMIKYAGKEANPVYPVPIIFDDNRFRTVIEKIRI